MAKFTNDEVEIIHRFLVWARNEGPIDDYSEFLSGSSSEGLEITEVSIDYDGCLEREKTILPWKALSDPDGYAADLLAAKKAEAERRKEYDKRQQEAIEYNEREQFRRLQIKYGDKA